MLYQSVLFDRGSEMAKKKKNYYVFLLRNEQEEYNQIGLVNTWEECQNVCSGKSGEKHQGFFTEEEVVSYLKKHTSLNKEKIDIVLRDRKLVGEIFEFYDQEKRVISNIAEHFAQIDNTTQQNVMNNEFNSNNTVSNTCIGIMKSCVQEHFVVEKKVNEFCKQFGFNNFSEEQKIAVQTVNGQILLFAIPGSGKTTVIIARTGYLVHGLGIDPRQIICITFTKAAAKEMKDRYEARFPSMLVPDFRTIHSLCYSIILPKLRRKGFETPKAVLGEKRLDDDKIITTNQIFNTIFKILKINKISKNDRELAIENAQNLISAIKNKQMKREEYSNRPFLIGKTSISCSQIFDEYQNQLRINDCMDFDDLLVLSYQGLNDSKYESVLKELREEYKYWNVDEAQDNSKLQYEIIKLICGTNGNLFMVGDDDQSIYSFRGASPKYLIEYGKLPTTVSLFMSMNYRSDSLIVEAAKIFIETNKNREKKEMHSFSERAGKIVIPKIFNNETEQYEYIVRAAKEAMKNKNSLAVLFRRNISSLPLIIHMYKNHIPYEANKGLKDLLKTRDIDFIWKLLCFVIDQNNLKKFYNVWMDLELQSKRVEEQFKLRAKDKFSEDILTVYENILNTISYEAPKKREKLFKINKIRNIIQKVINLSPSEAVVCINKELALLDLKSIGSRLRMYSLLSITDLYNTIEEFVQDINNILKIEKQKINNNKDELEEDTEAVLTDDNSLVTLSTIHSVKGREFSRVIIIDTLDEIMPGKIYEDSLTDDPEEERRLFYVAITRAANELDLLTVERYHGNVEKVSTFIKEFAFLSDFDNDNAILGEDNIIENTFVSTKFMVAPNKFYAVRVGRKPGVYTDWGNCEKQIKGFSNADFKCFNNEEDAVKYFGISEIKEKKLDFTGIDEYLIMADGVAFNKPIDLPIAITRAVYDRFNIKTISDFPKQKLDILKKESKLYLNNSIADYRSAADAYLLSYMPVNFFKIWKPLHDLATKEKLPTNCDILELGAGPGTSTLGLLSFYSKLAKYNTEKSFKLTINAVEKESRFKTIFNYLIEKIKNSLPSNLEADIHFINEDAFQDCAAYNQKYDLVMESNMFNTAEAISETGLDFFIQMLHRVLKSDSMIVMIEPADNNSKLFFKEIIEKMTRSLFNIRDLQNLHSLQICATDVSGVALFKDALKNGIRFKNNPYHWFSYITLFRNEET